MTTTTHTPVTAQTIDTPARASRGVSRKYATEALGTFVLMFTVGTSVLSGSALAPFAIGAALMAMVYAGGHISGGHYNPAVTMAVLVRGRIGISEALGYFAAQVSGGLVAAALVHMCVSVEPAQPSTPSGHAMTAAIVAEFVFTFVLCFVVLNVATSKDHPTNSFYGLAIGFTVAAGAVAVGPISGAVFNPAVGIAGATIGMLTGTVAGIYLIAQLLAAVGAGIAFRVLNPTDK
jgi:aquaporin Z